MKKLLLIIAALFAGSKMLAKPATERLMEFHTMKADQKIAWIILMKEGESQKANIMRAVIQDWRDFHNKWLKMIEENKDWSEQAREKLFNDKLSQAIELHKKHMAMWEDFAKTQREKNDALCKKHKEDLAKFEQKEAKEVKMELKETQQELEEATAPAAPGAPAAAPAQ
jgi:protein subunit release factor A